jgi:hypothetical protein
VKHIANNQRTRTLYIHLSKKTLHVGDEPTASGADPMCPPEPDSISILDELLHQKPPMPTVLETPLPIAVLFAQEAAIAGGRKYMKKKALRRRVAAVVHYS